MMIFFRWYQESLGEAVMSRSPPHLVLEELVRLMSWKLIRGKYRPNLLTLVKLNGEATVKSTTRDGIRAAQHNNLTTAITTLSMLSLAWNWVFIS